MAYLRPGVFINETLNPLQTQPYNDSEAQAAFVGTCSGGGPLGPTLVTSWSQYQALFGTVQNSTDTMTFAVYLFFVNGGTQAWICRAVNSDAVAASFTFKDTETTPANSLTVTASSVGAWASNNVGNSQIFVTIANSPLAGYFDMTVEVGNSTQTMAREVFNAITMNPADPRYALNIVNSPTIGSMYVTISSDVVLPWQGTNDQNPAPVTRQALTGGSDGTGTPSLTTAAALLNTVPGVLNVNFPGVTDSTDITALVNWAIGRGNAFVVVDAPSGDTASQLVTAEQGYPITSYCAVYAPWVYINDPASKVNGSSRLVPPGGAVLGQYMRNDSIYGVQKTPAGINMALNGVLNVQTTFVDSDLDTLNQSGVNVIRQVPGAGYCIMGGRTLDPGLPDRYINIRRTLMTIEREITNLTQFAIFEQNNSDLWDTVTAVVTQYLTAQYQAGVLQGSDPSQAFFVVCDDTNNTASNIGAATVNVQVGVALTGPAEFIVLNIGQYDAGSTTTNAAINGTGVVSTGS